ncbi:hypothetical protein A2J03_03300 [Rhodococcus sp. EPR-157]|uniref:hypothetical protein n=1 Tax=Rhodococcus sp. EPR-157 TaxID=1813677 RepID=UPI0007BC186D|nr:hypothetical protein [Rhodococcus sp. EPR-157]KZF09108.1 hypothetical protein A2J03_03300 [Rhodococcus sp. EPR-157]
MTEAPACGTGGATSTDSPVAQRRYLDSPGLPEGANADCVALIDRSELVLLKTKKFESDVQVRTLLERSHGPAVDHGVN